MLIRSCGVDLKDSNLRKEKRREKNRRIGSSRMHGRKQMINKAGIYFLRGGKKGGKAITSCATAKQLLREWGFGGVTKGNESRIYAEKGRSWQGGIICASRIEKIQDQGRVAWESGNEIQATGARVDSLDYLVGPTRRERSRCTVKLHGNRVYKGRSRD